MLFLILLIEGLVIAAVAYGVGALIAVGGWLVSKIIPPLKIPAFVRWALAALVVGVIGFWGLGDILNASNIQADDWANVATVTFKICFGLALAALVLTGILVSTTKAVVKGVAKGAKALAKDGD